MDEIHITGGRPLKGEVTIQGSKNAVLPMMAAALLTDEICVLKGCPRITDVACMEEILKFLGARTWWCGQDLYLDCSDADGTEIPGGYTGRMRSSVILAGTLLARSGRCLIGYPGGCVIGKRPVDMHIQVLKRLGAVIEDGPAGLRAGCLKLKGTTFSYPGKSVGATEQGILAAVLAEGETILENCAAEPEICWLCRFLRGMGARITGDGTENIRIQGVSGLRGFKMQVPPDRIVAGTYLLAAAASRGRIIIDNPPLKEMQASLAVYQKMGGQYECNSGKLIADARCAENPVPFLETAAYPGFPTDLQSPLLAALITARGISRIHETVFENRFRVAGELKKLGADIEIREQEAVICGGRSLKGARVLASELRGGAALVIAALAAEGESVVEGCGFIRRGYENICRDLTALGGQVTENTGT